MKKAIFLILSGLFIAGCSSTAPQITNTNAPAGNANGSVYVRNNPAEPVNTAAVTPSETKTKWTQSGNPIDTSEFDAEIQKAEKNFKARSGDESAKKALAEAYVKRGFALTEARQYASALGDYRRAIKLDPENEEAKKWIGQIENIYNSLNKDYPKEGEEPPPLAFKKESK